MIAKIQPILDAVSRAASSLASELDKLQKIIRHPNKKDVVKVLLGAVKIWLGAFAMFSLGTLAVLPWDIWSLVDETTLLFLAGNMTALIAISYAAFHVSAFMLSPLVALVQRLSGAIRFSRKFPDGGNSEVKKRYLRKLTWKLMSLGLSDKRVVAIQIVFGALFLMYSVLGPAGLFFTKEQIELPTFKNFVYVVAVVVLPIPIFLAYRTRASFRPNSTMFASRWNELSKTMLIMVFVIGASRQIALMASDPLVLSDPSGSCNLVPIFPVFTGELFYEQKSGDFVILHDSGNKLFLRYGALSEPTSC